MPYLSPPKIGCKGEDYSLRSFVDTAIAAVNLSTQAEAGLAAGSPYRVHFLANEPADFDRGCVCAALGIINLPRYCGALADDKVGARICAAAAYLLSYGLGSRQLSFQPEFVEGKGNVSDAEGYVINASRMAARGDSDACTSMADICTGIISFMDSGHHATVHGAPGTHSAIMNALSCQENVIDEANSGGAAVWIASKMSDEPMFLYSVVTVHGPFKTPSSSAITIRLSHAPLGTTRLKAAASVLGQTALLMPASQPFLGSSLTTLLADVSDARAEAEAAAPYSYYMYGVNAGSRPEITASIEKSFAIMRGFRKSDLLGTFAGSPLVNKAGAAAEASNAIMVVVVQGALNRVSRNIGKRAVAILAPGATITEVE